MGKQEKTKPPLPLARPNSSPALSSLSLSHHHPRLRAERAAPPTGWEGSASAERGRGTMVALAGWPEPVYVAMEDQTQWERRRSRPPSPSPAPAPPAEKHRSPLSTRKDARSRESSPPRASSSSERPTIPNGTPGGSHAMDNGAPRPPPRSIFAASCPYTTEGRQCPFPNHPDCFAGGHGQARFPLPSMPQLPRLPRPLQPPPPRLPTGSTHTQYRDDYPERQEGGGGSPLRRKTSLPPDFFKGPLSPPPTASASSSRPTSRAPPSAASPTGSHLANGGQSPGAAAGGGSQRRHGPALTMTTAKRSGLLLYKPTPVSTSNPRSSDGATVPRAGRTDQAMATEVYPRDPDSGFLWNGNGPGSGKEGEPDSGQASITSMEVDS